MLNQLARREPGSVRDFVKAVETLAKAQRTGTRVGEAIKAERQARQRVITRAEALAATAGARTTADTKRRIANTLLGVATNRAARDLLTRGELQGETQPSGFEQFEGVTLRVVKPGKPAPSLRTEARVEKRMGDRDLERIAREERAAAAATARQEARLERDLRALEIAARDAERAAEGAIARASEARETLEALQGRRRRSSDRG